MAVNHYRKRVSVVVLAAGMSSRMGKANKLLLPLNNQPLIKRTLETLIDHPFEEIIVVLGHQAPLVKDLISELDIRAIMNHDYQQGQMTSVHAGMSALTKETDGVMIFLSDLALINQSDLNVLRQAFDDCSTGVLVPTFEGKRGNPIILDVEQQKSVVSSNKNLGCKKLISKHPELVTVVNMHSDHVVMDMDTPLAYQQIKTRIEDSTMPGLQKTNAVQEAV